MKGLQVDHFMDLSFPGSNWTRFVRSARYSGGPVSNEYNLELSQRGNELYFIARHNIQPGKLNELSGDLEVAYAFVFQSRTKNYYRLITKLNLFSIYTYIDTYIDIY